jgi:hypothetical protein
MKIVAISGRKQAGKNTAANVLHGLVLERYGLVENWEIDGEGNLRVLTHDSSGNLGWGEFDVSRKDADFAAYADPNMWPYVKLYSFADMLKWLCTELFNLPHECVWGTDEDKNRLMPHLLWENMPGVTTEKTPQDPVDEVVAGRLGKYYEKVLSGVVYHEPGPMTARQFMQFIGTEIGRKMYEPIWIEATMKKIQREQSELAIIADCRFPNEAKAVEAAGGKVLRLTRAPFADDTHPSETAMDDYDFKHTIDNEGTELGDYVRNVREFYGSHLSTPAVHFIA